jgi:hypothetical protein
MAARFTSDALELPPPERPFERADLIFYGLDHSGPSYVGHCDIPAARDPFDLRPAHQLEPAVRLVTVTEPLQALLRQGLAAAKVTVVAHTEGRASNDALSFHTIRLATYA